jgi:hypothetical protein
MPAVGSSRSRSLGCGLDAAEAGVGQQLVGALDGVALLALEAGRAEDRAHDAAAEARMHADQYVLQRRHVLEEPDVLEGAADASLRERVRRLAGEVLAAEGDRAVGRLVDPGEHVEERRLAGPVGADQADDRACRDEEVHVVDGDEAAELLAHLLCDEQLVHSGASSS